MAVGTRLALLGPVQVERGGERVGGFESRKSVALLAYLALRSRPASRTHLADLFWPDLPETRGRANLSGALHNLNARVPGCLVADRHTVALQLAADGWVDTRCFEEHAACGTPEDLAAAADLYRDDLLADLYLEDCADFELWLVRQREEWRGRVTQVLGALVDHHAGRAEHPEALRFAARLLEIEPWREEAHRQLMALLAAAGQRSGALAQFETCRRVLAEELGVEPAAETVALYERIRAGDVGDHDLAGRPTPAEPPDNLPAEVTSFVGREAERAALAERLDNPACRLLSLVGPGGVGKSRLALAAAGDRRRSFPDGVFLVPLASVGDPGFVLSAVADALDFTPSAADPEAELLDHLRARRLLLVMDTFEHLLPGAVQLVDLLRAAPGVKVLVTSRERLNLQAEWLMPVEGMDVPPDDAAEPIERFSSVQLFVERARQVDPAFALGASTRTGVGRICRAVDGLPLAIELAASRVRETSCLAIAGEIARGLDALATSMTDVPARHRSLRAVLEQSWKHLPAEEQRAFARLSVFRGGFGAEGAGEVADVPIEALASLRARFLLRGEPSGRYDFHPLLRTFAAEKLRDGAADVASKGPSARDAEPGGTLGDRLGTPAPGAHDAVHRRHAAYFLALAEAAEAQFAGPDLEGALGRLRRDHDNLRAALEWAERSADCALGLRLCGALTRFWQMQGDFAEGRRWIEGFLALPDAASQAERAKALAGAGALAEEQGDYESAWKYHEASLAIRRVQDDRPGIAQALNKLGNVANFRGDADGARGLYTESLTIARSIEDTWAIAAALNNLGNVANFQSDYDEARRLYAESLVAFREVGDRWAISVTLNNLGLVASEQGDLVAAMALLDESLALARELGDRQGVAYALQNAGDVACRLGDLARSRRLHGESLTIRRDIGDHQGVAWSLESLASLAKAEGDAACAACLLGAAARLRETIGAPRPANERAEQEAEVAALRAGLGQKAFEAATRTGREMDEAEASAYALEAFDRESMAPLEPT